MKIACVGNCQTEVLSWYIKHLYPRDECKWISYNKASYRGMNLYNKFDNHDTTLLSNNFTHDIYMTGDEKQYIQDCDYMIFLKTLPKACQEYHTDALTNMLKPSCETVSITNLFLKRTDISESIKQMKLREQSRDVDIRLDDLLCVVNIEDITPIDSDQPNHPAAIYFLKLLQLICDRFKWRHFTQQQHDVFLQTGFPYG